MDQPTPPIPQAADPLARPERRSELGQATAEYALVVLGAAAVAGLFIAWAASTGRIGDLLNAVIDAVIGQVG